MYIDNNQDKCQLINSIMFKDWFLFGCDFKLFIVYKHLKRPGNKSLR